MDNNTRGIQQMCISLVPIFNHLNTDNLREMAKATHSESYGRGEIIYHPGEPSEKLYIVHQGRVKIYRLSESGKEQLIRILGPGDFTGELALFSTTMHDDYAEAMEDTELCTMQRGDLQAYLLKYPAISLHILSEFSNRLTQTEKQLARLATESADKRIAAYLLELSESQKLRTVKLPMTRKDLAAFLGTTPETVSRKLTEFENAGWIEQRKQLEIHIVDREALQRI